ncbi:MAG: outer membrane lipoprotein carrier protein LolA [Bacteroidales bacterium]|nr:outer membrane lipoprotein carrier protein LolA [Bacteroidales bacterium]
MRYLIPLLISVSCQLAAQKDPAAKEILDRVAAKTKQYQSIQADFSLVVVDHKEDIKNTSNGSIIIKGDKYKVSTAGTTVFYDGKTMWTYVETDNEVTITEPGSQEDDFLSNPAMIFTWYNRDFKYQYRGETKIDGIDVHEIDLFPKNLNQPYSRIKLFIAKKTEQLAIISSIGKDGIDYSVFLNNFIPDKYVADDVFVFDTSKHKKVTVIDMRGL